MLPNVVVACAYKIVNLTIIFVKNAVTRNQISAPTQRAIFFLVTKIFNMLEKWAREILIFAASAATSKNVLSTDVTKCVPVNSKVRITIISPSKTISRRFYSIYQFFKIISIK